MTLLVRSVLTVSLFVLGATVPYVTDALGLLLVGLAAGISAWLLTRPDETWVLAGDR